MTGTVPDNSVSRVEDAYSWLLGEITEFRLRSGTPLSENRLAAQLGISRTPVREALQRLEQEGLVKRSDTARFAVSMITAQELNDACDLLEVLDTYIFCKAARQLTPAATDAVRDNVSKMEQASMVGDRESWASADQMFHRTVNTAAGNVLVADMVKQVRRRVQRFWIRSTTNSERLIVCSAEHRGLAEAIIAGDTEKIGPAVRSHIGHMRNSVLAMLEQAALLTG